MSLRILHEYTLRKLYRATYVYEFEVPLLQTNLVACVALSQVN